jgi:plastocyanin
MRRLVPLLLVLAACGGGDGQSQPTPSPTTSPDASPAPSETGMPEIRVLDLAFSPATLTVAAMTPVRVRSLSENAHTWTHKPLFDIPLDGKGASSTFSFPTPGRYEYVCTIHQDRGMTGVVVVT